MEKTESNYRHKFAKGDIVEFESSEVAFHLSRFAGCCNSTNLEDYPKGIYTGVIRDVPEITDSPFGFHSYTIVTTRPSFPGIFCNFVSPSQIIRVIAERPKNRKPTMDKKRRKMSI